MVYLFLFDLCLVTGFISLYFMISIIHIVNDAFGDMLLAALAKELLQQGNEPRANECR